MSIHAHPTVTYPRSPLHLNERKRQKEKESEKRRRKTSQQNIQTNNQKPRESTLWAWLNSCLFTYVTCLVSIKILPIIHIPGGEKNLGVKVKQELSARYIYLYLCVCIYIPALLQVYRRPILIRKLVGSVPTSGYMLRFFFFFNSFLIAHRRGLIFFFISASIDRKKM